MSDSDLASFFHVQNLSPNSLLRFHDSGLVGFRFLAVLIPHSTVWGLLFGGIACNVLVAGIVSVVAFAI